MEANPKVANFAAACACFNLRKGARIITAFYDAALQPAGVRANQATLLMAIATANLDTDASQGGPTVSQLADLLGMDRTTLARDLQPLANHGWVAIRPGDDRRTRRVQLTEGGNTKLTELIPFWEEAQTTLIHSGFGVARWRAFHTDLHELIHFARR
jgi:DNA-binding MarR family transcriptional regulator